MRIVVIIPTYNEAENIGRMIDELVGREFPKIEKVDMHLLVVDDSSPDGTGKIVKQKMKKFENLHLLPGKKQGLGYAYVRGMKHAMEKLKADATIEMDADFQHDPKYVKDMVKAHIGGADYVIGSRYIPGGSIPEGWAWYRKAISYFGNLYARLVLWLPKVHDVTTGFRLTKVKGLLEKIDLDNLMELHRFAFKVDLLFKTLKLSKKTVEVPIHFAERKKEASKFNLKEMIATYKVVMILRIRESQRFIKFGIVGFIGYLVNAAGLEIFFRLGFSPGIAAAIGAEFAIISNFTLNNIWTFKEAMIKEPLRIIWKFLQFNLTSAGAILIQGVVVGVGAFLFGSQWRQILLIVAILLFVIPYNYTMYNVFIWKTWKIPGLAWLQKKIG